MHINKYMADPDVKGFVEWLASGVSFKHGYLIRRTGQRYVFSGLWDSYRQYDWSFKCAVGTTTFQGRTYAENAACLGVLQQFLRDALKRGSGPELARLSVAVFDWGGTRRGNREWAMGHSGLVGEYRAGEKMLNPSDYRADDDLKDFDLRFNAGLSKVYSLLLDDFVIYDSRVAAALGWMVVKYCHAHQLPAVPDTLAFPWSPGREAASVSDSKRRDPSDGKYQFPRLGDARQHARWNLRASWLIHALAARLPDFCNLPDGIRALESSLFMWGYDLTDMDARDTALPVSARPLAASSTPLAMTLGGGGRLHTLSSKAVEFFWRVDGDAVVIIRPESTLREVRVGLAGLISVLRKLAELYGGEDWTLDNNVADVANDRPEKPGFGRLLYREFSSTIVAQTASHLGPIFRESGLVKWNGRERGIKFRFYDPASIAVMTPERLVEILQRLD